MEWLERLLAVLKLGFSSMAWSTEKVDPEMFDPLRPRYEQDEFESPFEQSGHSPFANGTPSATKAASPNQAAAMFAATFGSPKPKRR